MKYSRNIQIHKEESKLETSGLKKRIKTHNWVSGVTGEKEYSIASSGVNSKSSFGKVKLEKSVEHLGGDANREHKKTKNENPGAWERGQG